MSTVDPTNPNLFNPEDQVPQIVAEINALKTHIRDVVNPAIAARVGFGAGTPTSRLLPAYEPGKLLGWSGSSYEIVNYSHGGGGGGGGLPPISTEMESFLSQGTLVEARTLLGAAKSGVNTDITELDGLTEVPAVVAAADAAVLASGRNYLLNPRAQICQAKNGLNHVVTYNSTGWTYVWDRWAVQCQVNTGSNNWAVGPVGTNLSAPPGVGWVTQAQFVPSEETVKLAGLQMHVDIDLAEMNGGSGGATFLIVLLRPNISADSYSTDYYIETLGDPIVLPAGPAGFQNYRRSFVVSPTAASLGFGIGVRALPAAGNPSVRVAFAGLYARSLPSARIERSMAAELRECQRFYCRGSYKMFASSQPVAVGAVTFPVPMFSTPTVTFASGYAGRGYQPTQMEWIDSYSMGFNRQTNSELSFDWFARAEIV